MADFPEQKTDKQTLITKTGLDSDQLQKIHYDTESAEVQFRLAQHAASLVDDEFGLVLGKKPQFFKFSVAQPFLVGRLSKEVAAENFFDLTPYGGDRKGVSRVHARFLSNEDKLTVEDMNSRNGTFINGSRLDMFVAQPLKHGDRLRFGNLVSLVVMPTSSNAERTLVKLSAVLAQENSLPFLDQQLIPYLKAFDEIQRLFDLAQASEAKVGEPQFDAVSVKKVTAIVEVKHCEDAIKYIKELQAQRAKAPALPIHDVIRNMKYVQERLIRSGDILKLTNFTRILTDAMIQLDSVE